MAYIQVAGSCYSSPDLALSAMAASMYGVNADGPFYTTVSGSALTTHYATGAVVSVTPDLQPCAGITPDTASLYSFAVVAVWAAAWSVVVLRRGLHDNP